MQQMLNEQKQGDAGGIVADETVTAEFPTDK
jgi:hypothetical protein